MKKVNQLVLLATAMLLLSPAALAETSDEAQATGKTAWCDLTSYITTSPQVFKGSEQKHHLLYELILNSYVGDCVIDSIEVLDFDKPGDAAGIYGTFSGKALEAMFLPIGASKGANVEKGEQKILFVNLERASDDYPKSLMHRIRYHHKTATSKTLVVDTPPFMVNREAPVKIGSPLRGKGWLACGGYASNIGHRRAIFPIDNKLQLAQRFAIDWLQVSPDGFTTKQDVNTLINSYCYRAPVYAVADGTVVGVVNRFEDQPEHKPTGDRNFPGGNSITIKMDNGYYAFYAHLIKNSPLVKAGDRVKKGQQLAHLGNSGNSTGPHLHFHVTSGPAPLGADGVPYVFDEFVCSGQINDVDKMISDDDKGLKQTIAPPTFGGIHRDELVRECHIVDFPVPRE